MAVVHSAYRDDRDAALAAADTLRRECDELHRENRYLRGLLDPAGPWSGRAQAVAQLQGALAATTLFLGALAGAAFVAHEPEPVARYDASAPCPRAMAIAALRGGDPLDGLVRDDDARSLRGLVAVDVLPAVATGAVTTASTEAPDAALVTTLRLRAAYAPTLPAVARCFDDGGRGRLHVTVAYDRAGAAVAAEVEAHRGAVDAATLGCVRAASLGAALGGQRAPSVTAQYTVDVRHGSARLRRVRW